MVKINKVTIHSKIILEKLTAAQLAKQLPGFNCNQIITAMSVRACH
jgi:hypothetical protein